MIVIRTAAISLAAASLLVGATTRAQSTRTLGFDQDKPGAPPAGFVFAAMRQPNPGTWAVRRDGANGYVTHETTTGAVGYALAVYTGVSWNEVVASVRLRLAGGQRAGGLVWHYVDDQHYYASVLDLTRREISMYRMAGGNRITMEVEDDLELDPEAWHTMKVSHSGNSTRVSLGGIRVFEHNHRSHDRIEGRVGLVSSGNAEVWYDDLHIEPNRNR